MKNLPFIPVGFDVFHDERIYAQCTRLEDALEIARTMNTVRGIKMKPVKKKPVKFPVKKKVRKR